MYNICNMHYIYIMHRYIQLTNSIYIHVICNMQYTVTILKYVEGGPDHKVPELV